MDHPTIGASGVKTQPKYNVNRPRPIPLSDRLIALFWSKVDRRTPIECWEWAGPFNSKGYGLLWRKRRQYGAHRVSYAIHYGEPGNSHVCHTCDNPRCVNPYHLFLGDATDNMGDAADKGRVARGERSHAAKLTEQDVRHIRREAERGVPQRAIAAQFDVSQVTIHNILTGKAWRHVR